MRRAAEVLRGDLEFAEIGDARVPVIANVTGSQSIRPQKSAPS